VQTLLSPADAAFVRHQRKRPVALLARLRQIVEHSSTAATASSATGEQQLPPILGTTVHRLLEDNLRQLNDVVTVGERIRASPVPPVYNSHTSRLMTIYLLCLPYALLGARTGNLAAVAVTRESVCHVPM